MRGRAMGTGSSNRIAFAFGVLLAGSLSGEHAAQGYERTTGIWKVLRAGNFSGAMDEDAHVTPMPGSITTKGKTYRFMEFAWEESRKNAAGTEPHTQYRLLVFEQNGGVLSYLGSYLYSPSDFLGDVHPKVRGKRSCFLITR